MPTVHRRVRGGVRGRRTRTAHGSGLGRTLRGGVFALLVAGYALLASASAPGHGWWLVQHTATAHHETVPDHDGGDHEHESGDHPGAPHAHEHAPHSDAAAVHGAHAHGGVVHTHDAPPRPPETVLVSGLDKHCAPPALPLPVPPVSRGVAVAGDVPVPGETVEAVEAPPPRRTA